MTRGYSVLLLLWPRDHSTWKCSCEHELTSTLCYSKIEKTKNDVCFTCVQIFAIERHSWRSRGKHNRFSKMLQNSLLEHHFFQTSMNATPSRNFARMYHCLLPIFFSDFTLGACEFELTNSMSHSASLYWLLPGTCCMASCVFSLSCHPSP